MGIFRRFDHLAIGVNDIDKARKLFCDVLGGEALDGHHGSVPEEGFDWCQFRLGGSKLELVTAHKQGEGGVGRYIEKYGEGYHHISISVDNLEDAIAYFEENGVRVLAPNTEDPTWKHCYLHPKDTFGAMIQVFEENQSST